MSSLEVIKNFVLTTLGHSVSGACVGAVYEVTQYIQNQQYGLGMLLTAALIGGSLGFFKSAVEEISKLKKQPIATAVANKKSVKAYMGF